MNEHVKEFLKELKGSPLTEEDLAIFYEKFNSVVRDRSFNALNDFLQIERITYANDENKVKTLDYIVNNLENFEKLAFVIYGSGVLSQKLGETDHAFSTFYKQ
jgi:hypothetical protein